MDMPVVMARDMSEAKAAAWDSRDRGGGVRGRAEEFVAELRAEETDSSSSSSSSSSGGGGGCCCRKRCSDCRRMAVGKGLCGQSGSRQPSLDKRGQRWGSHNRLERQTRDARGGRIVFQKQENTGGGGGGGLPFGFDFSEVFGTHPLGIKCHIFAAGALVTHDKT